MRLRVEQRGLVLMIDEETGYRKWNRGPWCSSLMKRLVVCKCGWFECSAGGHQQVSHDSRETIKASACCAPRCMARSCCTAHPPCTSAHAAPDEEGPVAESMMAVLKCSWLKDAATERLMRSISLNVSSLP